MRRIKFSRSSFFVFLFFIATLAIFPVQVTVLDGPSPYEVMFFPIWAALRMGKISLLHLWKTFLVLPLVYFLADFLCRALPWLWDRIQWRKRPFPWAARFVTFSGWISLLPFYSHFLSGQSNGIVGLSASQHQLYRNTETLAALFAPFHLTTWGLGRLNHFLIAILRGPFFLPTISNGREYRPEYLSLPGFLVMLVLLALEWHLLAHLLCLGFATMNGKFRVFFTRALGILFVAWMGIVIGWLIFVDWPRSKDVGLNQTPIPPQATSQPQGRSGEFTMKCNAPSCSKVSDSICLYPNSDTGSCSCLSKERNADLAHHWDGQASLGFGTTWVFRCTDDKR